MGIRYRDFKIVNGRLVPVGPWVDVPLPEFRPVKLVFQEYVQPLADADDVGLPIHVDAEGPPNTPER